MSKFAFFHIFFSFYVFFYKILQKQKKILKILFSSKITSFLNIIFVKDLAYPNLFLIFILILNSPWKILYAYFLSRWNSTFLYLGQKWIGMIHSPLLMTKFSRISTKWNDYFILSKYLKSINHLKFLLLISNLDDAIKATG